MISPTGKDIIGLMGVYGADRRENDGSVRRHSGADFAVEPDGYVYCPIDNALIVREARPYKGEEYSGLLIRGKNVEIKMFYFSPFMTLIGKTVRQGQPLGRAQDISKKYDTVEPHIHLRIYSMNPEILLNMEKMAPGFMKWIL